MIKITGLGHLLLRVSDLDRMLAFYVDLLGFELVERGDEVHGRMAFLSLGRSGHVLDLKEVPAAQLATAAESRLHHLALQVDAFEDLRAAWWHLQAAGVSATAVDHVSQQSLHLRDPEGNGVEIYYEVPGALQMFREGREDRDTPLEFAAPDQIIDCK